MSGATLLPVGRPASPLPVPMLLLLPGLLEVELEPVPDSPVVLVPLPVLLVLKMSGFPVPDPEPDPTGVLPPFELLQATEKKSSVTQEARAVLMGALRHRRLQARGTAPTRDP